MGFSFKVAPGVRVRASSRGVRASVGPRAARVHFGSGGVGVSTGAGPVSLYSSLGGGRRAGKSRASVAAQQRRLAAADKAEQARELADAFQAILNLHRADFSPAQRPQAPAPPPVSEGEVRRRHKREALAGVGIFNRAERAKAKQAARGAAEEEIVAIKDWNASEHARLQRDLDRQWERLCANDPDTVLATLEEAFEDNDAPAAAVGVHADEVSLVVLAPGMDAVPERFPTTTEAGNLSLRKLPKTKRASVYVELVCGHLLLTVREAFAVAPGLGTARVAVIRNPGRDAYGKPRVECLMAVRIPRKALDGIRWNDADAHAIVNDAATEQVANQAKRTHEPLPIDLSREPELAVLLDRVDLDELTEGRG